MHPIRYTVEKNTGVRKPPMVSLCGSETVAYLGVPHMKDVLSGWAP